VHCFHSILLRSDVWCCEYVPSAFSAFCGSATIYMWWSESIRVSCSMVHVACCMSPCSMSHVSLVSLLTSLPFYLRLAFVFSPVSHSSSPGA
jgi:hypothetical protein